MKLESFGIQEKMFSAASIISLFTTKSFDDLYNNSIKEMLLNREIMNLKIGG